MGKCQHAFRKNADASLHCDLLSGKDNRRDWCAHQYLCKRTKMWEVSDGACECEILKNSHREKS